MRPRSLLVMTLVVLALVAFVWFYERKLPSTEEARAEAKKVLAGVEADEVREVGITRGGATLRLVREGPPPKADDKDGEDDEDETDENPFDVPPTVEWRLTAPLSARADRAAVEGLLSSLLGLEKSRTLDKVDRREYGLAPPAAQVTLVTAEGKRVLEVGRELPGTGERAVAVAGEPAVHSVASSFWSELTKAPGDWRSRELFPGTRDEVERVKLQHGGATLLLARRGGEPWLEAPLADRADPQRFDGLVDALTGLQALEFLDSPPGPPAALGLEPPQGVVEVVRAGTPRPFRLELGAVQDEGGSGAADAPDAGGERPGPVRYARADGQLVTLQVPALDEALARAPEEWRSRAWTSFAVYEVDRLKAQDAQGSVEVTRDESDWKRGKDKIFYGTVSDLLGALADVQAERVLDGAEAARLVAGKPALTLELVGGGGKKETLMLWPPTAEGAPARGSGRDAVLLLPAAVTAELQQKVAAVRKAEPLKDVATPTPSP